jgi:hypothetical protein
MRMTATTISPPISQRTPLDMPPLSSLLAGAAGGGAPGPAPPAAAAVGIGVVAAATGAPQFAHTVAPGGMGSPQFPQFRYSDVVTPRSCSPRRPRTNSDDTRTDIAPVTGSCDTRSVTEHDHVIALVDGFTLEERGGGTGVVLRIRAGVTTTAGRSTGSDATRSPGWPTDSAGSPSSADMRTVSVRRSPRVPRLSSHPGGSAAASTAVQGGQVPQRWASPCPPVNAATNAVSNN